MFMVLPLNDLRFSNINTELSRASTARFGLGDAEARELAETGNSGQDQSPNTPIRASNLRRRARNASIITGLSQNFQIENTSFSGNYSSGLTLFKITVDDSGVIGSSSRLNAAILVRNLANGDIVNIVNRGRITGAGGAGGAGNSGSGTPGGTGLSILSSINNAIIRINNSGQIYGGGGGGGGGGFNDVTKGPDAHGGSGGGGAGYVAGIGGPIAGNGGAGSPGTLDNGGLGGPGGVGSGPSGLQFGGPGGPGGSIGFPGTPGSGAPNGGPGPAGSAGASIIGLTLPSVNLINNGLIRPTPT
jgi:hypothetical protein